MKALSRFGSDYEDQRVGDYLNRLTGGVNTGMSATGQATGLLGRGIDTRFGADTQSALGGVAAAQAKQGALTNLLGLVGGLGGAFLGGPGGAALGKGLGGMFGGAPSMSGGMGAPMYGGPSRLY